MDTTTAIDAAGVKRVEAGITLDDYSLKLNELDHLLNNPDVSWDPARVWSLLDEVLQCSHDAAILPMTTNAAVGRGPDDSPDANP